MIRNKLNSRQHRCLAALRHGCDQLFQQDKTSAAWYVMTPAKQWVRLSLDAGDIWMLIKLGFLIKHPTERKFSLVRPALVEDISVDTMHFEIAQQTAELIAA
ncbi:hypothetical protein ACI2KR_27380 [Pseudomonas luteola]